MATTASGMRRPAARDSVMSAASSSVACGVEARLVASLKEIALAYSVIDEHSLACCSVFDDGGVALASACEHM